ncbi:MAG: type II toxin-antitoxin system RelE/ParE family toxin [Rickettsia endosymbiont of Ixodes ricinus]|nr:type II toxin-antitoxin system RelE/ParE family toxin [Rickettsia helvetica]MCZ6884235.1 type II toxin-antitoxin system RelE/ParE family toxin [Rickettsia endosymbiont of Ixodes ricinus]MCZ6896757.1 type II toxin-antitoxin system RelE/ParE family toxin [Rickettsia endosymbiont of Ixodes ricinus]
MNNAAEKEVQKLTYDLQADFLHLCELLIEFSPHNVGMPHTRNIEDKLWELRLHGKDNIARSIYYLAMDKKIVILHTFIKKTEKTLKTAILIAKTRLKKGFNEKL